MNREQRRAAAQEIKKLQKMEAAKFAVWLTAYQKAAYQDGFEDGVECNNMAIMRYLHDAFGWGNTRFSRLIEHAKKDVQAMREGYVSPKDVKDGLAEEGVTCLKQLQMKGEADPLREWVPDEIPRPGLTIMPADVNVEMYKLHLKDMLFKRIAMASMQEEMVSIYADFGYEVAQELLKVK